MELSAQQNALNLLSASARQDYAPKARLFTQRQAARGVFIVQAGEVELSIGLNSARPLRLGIAGTGAVLGLPETVANHPYQTTATALVETQVSFISKHAFESMLRADPIACLHVVSVLSSHLRQLYEQIRCYHIPRSNKRRS